MSAAAALGVAVLYAVSVPTGSLMTLPGTDVPATETLSFFVDHRDGMLAAVVLNGIAWCALMPLVFVGLRARITGEGSLAASIALAAALVEAAMIGVALLFGAIVAYAAPDLSPALARVLDYGLAGAFSPDGIALLGAPVFAVGMAVIGVALLRRGPEFLAVRSDA